MQGDFRHPYSERLGMLPAVVQVQAQGIQNDTKKIVEKDMGGAQDPEYGDEDAVPDQGEQEHEIAGDEIAVMAAGKVVGNSE